NVTALSTTFSPADSATSFQRSGDRKGQKLARSGIGTSPDRDRYPTGSVHSDARIGVDYPRRGTRPFIQTAGWRALLGAGCCRYARLQSFNSAFTWLRHTVFGNTAQFELRTL